MQDEVNQEESEQNEIEGMKKGADSMGEVMHNETTNTFHGTINDLPHCCALFCNRSFFST